MIALGQHGSLLQISQALNTTGLYNFYTFHSMPKKFDFVHQTVSPLAGCGLGTRLHENGSRGSGEESVCSHYSHGPDAFSCSNGMCGRKSLAGEGEGSGVSGPYSAGIYSIRTCSCHMTLPKVFNIYQDSTSIKKAMV